MAILIAVMAACLCLAACDRSPQTDDPARNEEEGTADVTEPKDDGQHEQEGVNIMYITIGGNKLEVSLADNSAVDALVNRLKRGDIEYEAHDYEDFEKVGGLGFDLPTEDTRITTQPGDVVLYLGNQLVLFYGSNTWSYTRIGKINGRSAAELRALLGAGGGTAKVRLSLS